MSLGSLSIAKQVFQRHDFSRQNQIRILDVGPGVPSYVRRDLIDNGGHYYATTLVVPGKNITNIDVPVGGFNFKIPGQTSYEPNPWTVSFRTPGDYFLRDSFERWSFETMNEQSMCGAFQFPCDTSSLDIAVFTPGCEGIKGYRLIGVYPQSVGEISYDQTAIEVTNFSVALQYQYWRPLNLSDTGSIDASNRQAMEIDNVYQSLEANSGKSAQSCGIAVPSR
jgi:hypothetical protein